MTLRFRVLGSGSSGNATLVESGSSRVLLDAGLGSGELAERLEDAGVEPGSLAAIVLSHEHGDHARGAASFSRRFGVPLAGSRGTERAAAVAGAGIPGYRRLPAGETLRLGALEVTGVAVPHDASEPLAFVVAAGGATLGHATDLGHVSRGVVAAFRHCSALLLESNHDAALLRSGPYPFPLKERIAGPLGHLSNADVARYLERGLGPDCRTLVLAHLSEKNNHPDLARMSAERGIARAGRSGVRLELCGREGTGWLEVSGGGQPRRPGAAGGGRQMRLFP